MSWSRLLIQQNAKKWLHQMIANKNLFSLFIMNYRGKKQGAKEFGHFILTFYVKIQIYHKTVLHLKDIERCFVSATKITFH